MEQSKQIIAWELLVILLFSSLLVIKSVDDYGITITGRAIAGVTQNSLRTQIEQALPKLNFISDVNDASVCLIVNIDASTKYSYDLLKIGQATVVTNSTGLCKGESNEDFILSYISYDALKKQLDNPPSFQELKQASGGSSFYLYPSKQVAPGAIAANPQDLDAKFGTVLRKNLPADEVQRILNPPTAAQLQSPSSLASYFFYFIGGLVVLVVVVTLFIFTHAKKPIVKEELEITSYIKSALSQGYQQEQVYQILLQSGWPQEQVDEAFRSINTEAPQQA